ncbi:MAG: tetratricopeptide repeat protein [Acidobacteria bacterium]|nr:tetratricopeptide repeat protein [Acidobacteriota bacterium]
MPLRVRLTPARTAALVGLCLVLLSGLTAGLARYYVGERAARAASHLERGRMLVRAGEVERGLAELRASLALNRGDPETALVLATALLEANRLHEAETYLDEAIAADPTSGPANLARARVARALGADETDTYYQRAYYGSWGLATLPQRVTVGFELVEYLLSRGERDRARGVLTQLAVDAGHDTGLLLRVALLQIDAGAASDAVPILRDVVARRPGDGPAWSALAAAAFALYEDQIAARAAAQALNLDKRDQQAQRIRRLATAALEQDPRAGRLGSRERLRRAQHLVEGAAAALDRCRTASDSAGDAAAPSRDAESTRRQVDRIMATRPPADLDLDDLIDLATRLWADRQDDCPVLEADLEPLARVFQRLAAGATR